MMEETEETSDSDTPFVDDNVIRIQLRKPCHKKWELRTRNLSLGIKFPTVQLFDCDGNLLIETNDENVSIKSYTSDEPILRSSQSLKERRYINLLKNYTTKKLNSVSDDIIYTKLFKTPTDKNAPVQPNEYVIRNSGSVSKIPIQSDSELESNNSEGNSVKYSQNPSEVLTDFSSFKSTDNDSQDEYKDIFITSGAGTLLVVPDTHHSNRKRIIPTDTLLETESNINRTDFENKDFVDEKKEISKIATLQKSQSFSATRNTSREINSEQLDELSRSQSGIIYFPPRNKISFLDTYLKSLPVRSQSNPDWFPSRQSNTNRPIEVGRPIIKLREAPEANPEKTLRFGRIREITSENDSPNTPSDTAAACEFKRRLKIYRRGISEIGYQNKHFNVQKRRRHSECELVKSSNTSSSESVDEADVVLSRLRRRILRNKIRERRKSFDVRKAWPKPAIAVKDKGGSDEACAGVAGASRVTTRAMGSNISQHSSKGLKGRRARSSGDLCNGDSKSQTESSVSGSVVGDAMGWNRSLPNHLDGNRHLADYSRVSDCDFTTYNRYNPKAGRALRYRVSKSGSELEPVWKLQDPGFDQGYGSERSPEEDYVPPVQPSICYEEYEAQLRTIYPFITEENTFTVVVEKDGRGLGMSVCGGGGLVRIRRLYPPQPAWRTGQLAQRDLLLAANGVPLAGLSTYEALEVLRTAAPRVELRVCRPPPDLAQSVTPPDPPTPPARTPHPPPPLDPLNCHPMHARLSQTTSSATTSSSEGRGRRDASPDSDRRELRLPDLEHSLPVYDVQYGEFDIVMTKINGSLGFTLRKEDHSALGHYVRALVREPALSDGRIQPGDRIVAVNDTPMSNMSHSEAVAFLRACEPEVRLRLYRDNAATPLSPTSPKDDGHTDSDGPIRPKPPLRPEAVSMLCDLAARRLTPDVGDAPRSPCLSPRKFRKLTKDNHYEQHDGQYTIECVPEARPETDRRAPGAHGSPTPSTSRKQKLSLTVASHGYELNNLNNEALDAPNVYQEDNKRYVSPFPEFNGPVSMPVDLSSDENRFAHTNPAYQSVVLPTDAASSSEGHKDDGNGLKKWKGVTLSPDNERKPILDIKPKIDDTLQKEKENVDPVPLNRDAIKEPTVVTVELNRGWNSRLGFSVQSHPDSGQSYISAVYSDSVAARDGRLRKGDVILQVNDENVTSMKTPEVIDLLRILRGSICITVLRPPDPH